MYNDLYCYDNGQWGPIAPTNNPPTPRKGHSTWYINGKVYVHGGKGKSQAMGDLWSYEVGTRKWTEVQTTGIKPQPRHSHTATVLQDGSVLLLGGKDFSDFTFPDFWKLNPDNTYTPLAPSPLPLANHVAQLVENDLFVFGDPNEVLIYNLTNNQWETHEPAPRLWGYFTSALRRNEAGQAIVMLFGGIKKDGSESDLVYEYNTATRTLSQRPEKMPFTHSYGAAATLVQQQGGPWEVLFFGGMSGGAVIGTTFKFSLGTLPVPPTLNAGYDPQGRQFVVRFNSETGQSYVLLGSTNLSAPMWAWLTNLAGDGTWLEYRQPATGDAMFFKATTSRSTTP